MFGCTHGTHVGCTHVGCTHVGCTGTYGHGEYVGKPTSLAFTSSCSLTRALSSSISFCSSALLMYILLEMLQPVPWHVSPIIWNRKPLCGGTNRVTHVDSIKLSQQVSGHAHSLDLATSKHIVQNIVSLRDEVPYNNLCAIYLSLGDSYVARLDKALRNLLNEQPVVLCRQLVYMHLCN